MRIYILLAGALLGFMPAAAGASPECLINKYEQFAKAQETWQRELARLIVEVAPGYDDVAQVYLRDQLRRIEQAKIAVAVLAYQEPDKLRTQMSLNNWLNLTEADRQRIATTNERYAELIRLGKESRDRPPHPDGDGLREVMRSNIMASSKYQTLQEAFLRSAKAAEEHQCQ